MSKIPQKDGRLMERKFYDSDLTDSEWNILRMFMPPDKSEGLERSRRLSKDYERLPASSEAIVYLGMIRLMKHLPFWSSF